MTCSFTLNRYPLASYQTITLLFCTNWLITIIGNSWESYPANWNWFCSCSPFLFVTNDVILTVAYITFKVSNKNLLNYSELIIFFSSVRYSSSISVWTRPLRRPRRTAEAVIMEFLSTSRSEQFNVTRYFKTGESASTGKKFYSSVSMFTW